MSQFVVKRAIIFSLILGALFGLLALLPMLIGLVIFIFGFFSSVIIILYMKRNEKHLSFLTNEQGAILGGIIGFFATVGFFVSFCPMVCIIHSIFKSYYSYAIPEMLSLGLWLFFVIVFMTAIIFAMTNSATAMGLTFILGQIEKKPDDYDAPLDIKIED